MTYSAGKLCQIPIIYLYIKHILHKQLHSRVKSISTLRYFPIYFILNHLFSTHSPEVIPCLIFMKFSALIPKINIVSSSYNFHKILFILFLIT